MSCCLETYLQQSDDYEILIKQASFKDCAKTIESKSERIVHINSGEKILGARIIGLPPIPIGINETKLSVIMPYTKPCYGTSVIEVPITKEDIEEIESVAESSPKVKNKI